MKKCVAEMIGTMVLVLMDCGSAVFAGGIADTHPLKKLNIEARRHREFIN